VRVLFNRTLPAVGASISEPSQAAIENTLNLRQCSLEDAVRYGGSITREAIGAMQLKGDRRYIVVDTKVNHLMRGMLPAIPGWHTDGVPRGDNFDPGGKGEAKISAQAEGEISASHYHLLVTGTISQTEFIAEPVSLEVEDGRQLYEKMSRDIEARNYWLHRGPNEWARPGDGALAKLVAPADTVVTWDWWNVHRAVPASGVGFRYLIRVTETDHIAPRTDPSDFIRMQSIVYVPIEFGW
jgi:hypothetical protein